MCSLSREHDDSLVSSRGCLDSGKNNKTSALSRQNYSLWQKRQDPCQESRVATFRGWGLSNQVVLVWLGMEMFPLLARTLLQKTFSLLEWREAARWFVSCSWKIDRICVAWCWRFRLYMVLISLLLYIWEFQVFHPGHSEKTEIFWQSFFSCHILQHKHSNSSLFFEQEICHTCAKPFQLQFPSCQCLEVQIIWDTCEENLIFISAPVGRVKMCRSDNVFWDDGIWSRENSHSSYSITNLRNVDSLKQQEH